MINKKIGTAFEQRVCNILSMFGYWVHLLSPNVAGSQPFDIIAVKDGNAFAIECKTLTTDKRYFPISRLEANQIAAFEFWMKKGNSSPIIVVEYGDKIRAFDYTQLKEDGKVDMREECHGTIYD